MQKRIRAAIVGYGNIGKYALEALESSSDFEVAGVVRRDSSNVTVELQNYNVVSSITDLKDVDVALICTPTRKVEGYAKECLAAGINSVDSFDIHNQILDHRNILDKIAIKNNAVSIVSAGWDPGSDSVIRTVMEALAPKGITYTDFGPGMSMGHTVAVKAISGVKNALSMTVPTGAGVHRRMVYIELEDGSDFNTVSEAIKNDDYFVNDETHVYKVDDVEAMKDMGHGVLMKRKGASGNTQNQLFKFEMKINNPALTAQVLVGAARATFKQSPGAYTMIEVPIVDLLPGDKEQWINKLV